MAKLVLDMDAMQDDFFSDAALIGIGSALPAYNFCWLLNRHFGISFIRDTDQNISLKKKDKEFIFPVYNYIIPNSDHKYLLYKLKSGTESLLPETRQLDYLWLVQTANPTEDAKEILKGLKELNEVQLANILQPRQLKSLNNLLV